MPLPAKRTAHYVVSTHWDREWYESFQDYRARLVSLLDEVLDLMLADPRFAYWQADGQTILIEDYLEIRPERRADISRLAGEGRLRIGPWFVLPDEFLVSGESLVRNLQLGLEIASQYGPPSRAGFACDLFGHNSQLPQILRGFSIDSAFIWRGMNESTHGGLFRWQAADGSEVIAYRFSPRIGYCSFAGKVRGCFEYAKPFNVDEAVKNFADYLAFEKERIPTPSLLVFDGGDHIEAEPNIVEFIERVNAKLKDVQVVFSHLDGFVEDLREQRPHIRKVFQGELRDPGEVGGDEWLIPGVLSSRAPLKQANARCENELCLWAEPLSCFAERAAGRGYPHAYLHVAWKHLITNHPHDSICGCSIDAVHKDMEFRFDQSLQISRRLARESMRAIALRVRRPAVEEKDISVVVFNPLAHAVDAPVDLTLRLPKEWPTFQEFFGFEAKPAFRLFDADGAEVPYQLVAQRRDRMAFYRRRYKFPEADPRHEIDITAPLKIGSCGYTTLVCRPVEKEPTRHLGTMAVDDHTIENEHLRVSVQPNGALRLLDKRSNQAYENLLTFEDSADIGDGWYHGVALHDQVFTSAASRAEVALVADGIAKATLKIGLTMTLPRAFRFDEMVRSDETAPLRITSWLTLRRGADHVEVRTVVDNVVRDHRLRVLLPTGCRAETYFADSAFDVVERPIALRKDNARLKELEVETRPQYTWTAVAHAGGGRGLAVVSPGQLETAVRDQPERPIAMTLFRSFLKAVFTSGNEGGEIQGTRESVYAIAPFAGPVPRVRLSQLGQSLAAPPRSVQLEPRDFTEETPEPCLPPSQSFLGVSPGRAIVTAIHRRRGVDGLLVRMFNPGDAAIEETIELCDEIGSAEVVDFEDKPREALSPSGRKVKVALRPRQIVTVRLAVGSA